LDYKKIQNTSYLFGTIFEVLKSKMASYGALFCKAECKFFYSLKRLSFLNACKSINKHLSESDKIHENSDINAAQSDFGRFNHGAAWPTYPNIRSLIWEAMVLMNREELSAKHANFEKYITMFGSKLMIKFNALFCHFC
jgi:hypothetical protein